MNEVEELVKSFIVINGPSSLGEMVNDPKAPAGNNIGYPKEEVKKAIESLKSKGELKQERGILKLTKPRANELWPRTADPHQKGLKRFLLEE